MANQQIFYNDVTVTALATARSIYDLVTDTSLDHALSPNLGQCVSLNFVGTADMKVGFGTAQVDATHGVTLTAGTAFADSATGVSGNTIPIAQIYLYSTAGSTVTIYLRFIG